jgi:hypothetical protein
MVVSFVVSVVSFCFFVLRLSFIWTVLSFYFVVYCLLFYAEFGVTFSFLVVLFSRFKCNSGFLGFCCEGWVLIIFRLVSSVSLMKILNLMQFGWIDLIAVGLKAHFSLHFTDLRLPHQILPDYRHVVLILNRRQPLKPFRQQPYKLR